MLGYGQEVYMNRKTDYTSDALWLAKEIVKENIGNGHVVIQYMNMNPMDRLTDRYLMTTFTLLSSSAISIEYTIGKSSPVQ
jgi:hypothetical protein